MGKMSQEAERIMAWSISNMRFMRSVRLSCAMKLLTHGGI